MLWFENDVKTYGTQAWASLENVPDEFENDVKTYGTQALEQELQNQIKGLRMM